MSEVTSGRHVQEPITTVILRVVAQRWLDDVVQVTDSKPVYILFCCKIRYTELLNNKSEPGVAAVSQTTATWFADLPLPLSAGWL